MPFWKKKKNPEQLQQEAISAFENGDMEQAFGKFVELREVHPTSEGLYYLGVMLDILDQKNESIKALNQSVELDPNNSQALYSLAVVNQSLEKHSAAFEASQGAFKAAPDDFRIVNLYANYLVESPIPSHRDLQKGTKLSRKACELTQWEDEICLDSYKRARIASGESAEAVEAEIASCKPEDLTFELIAHVEQQIGAKANVNSLQNIVPYSNVSIAVQTIESSSEETPTLIFTTGMSSQAMHRRDGNGIPFAELCMYLPASWKPSLDIDDRIWPWQSLQQIANRPHMDDERYEREGYSGDPEVVCVSGTPEPLGVGTDYSAFLLLTNVEGHLAPFVSESGKTIQLVTAMPIYRQEYELAQREGATKLADLIIGGGVKPVLAPERPSVV